MKFFIKVFLVSMFLLVSELVYARGVDNNSNMSAEYVRTANRNAAIDLADAVYYNPAGTPFLTDGFHLYLSNQFMIKKYTQVSYITGREYVADNPTLFLPSFYAVYKNDKTAAFLAFNIPGGGGQIEYKNGVAKAEDISTNEAFKVFAEGSIIYYAGTMGFAHSFSKYFSASAAFRVIAGERTRKATMSMAGTESDLMKMNSDATGLGGIFGVDVTPIEKLRIALRFETPTKLNWTIKDFEDKSITKSYGYLSNGLKYRRDLPAVLAAGVNYDIIKNLRAEANFNFYFNKWAKWDDIEDGLKPDNSGAYDNGWDAGLALEYTLPINLKISAGFIYGSPGENQQTYYENNPSLKGPSIAGGLYYEPFKYWGISAGVLYTIYKSDDRIISAADPVTNTAEKKLELKKSVILIGVGTQVNFGH